MHNKLPRQFSNFEERSISYRLKRKVLNLKRSSSSNRVEKYRWMHNCLDKWARKKMNSMMSRLG